MKELGDILTVQELSAYLRIHPSTIYRLLAKKEIPSFRVGADHRFRKEAIDHWMTEQEAGLSPHPGK